MVTELLAFPSDVWIALLRIESTFKYKRLNPFVGQGFSYERRTKVNRNHLHWSAFGFRIDLIGIS